MHMDESNLPNSKEEFLNFLKGLPDVGDDSPLEFTADQLDAYMTGKADPLTIQTIEAARQLDPQVDEEIRILQGELALVPEFRPTVERKVNYWKWSTFGLGLAACGLAALLVVGLGSKPKELARLGNSTIVQIGGQTFAMAELSKEAVAALGSGSINAGSSWVSVSPPGNTRGSDEFAVTTPVDTTLEASHFSLAFKSPADVTSVTVSLTGPQAIQADASTGRFEADLLPGLYSVRLQGVASNGQVVTSDFRIRVMDAQESESYNRELASATNPLDRLIVYANHGVRHEFQRVRMALGPSAPDIEISSKNSER